MAFTKGVRVFNLPMTRWIDEVKAAVNTVVNNVSSVETTLICEVAFKLIIYILYDGLETVDRIII